jgi:hypothetical protein
MKLNPDFLEQFASAVADRVYDRIQSAAFSAPDATRSIIPRRMTVAQFAICVNLCDEVVRRRIRERFIPPTLVEGRPRGQYHIDRAALDKFHVTPAVALERLQAHQAEQTPQSAQPSAA